MSGIVLLAFLQNVVCALLSAVCLIVGTTRANLPRDIFVVLLVKVSPGGSPSVSALLTEKHSRCNGLRIPHLRLLLFAKYICYFGSRFEDKLTK